MAFPLNSGVIITDRLHEALGLTTQAKELSRALDRDADAYLRLVREAPGSVELAEVENRLRRGVEALDRSPVGKHYGKRYAGAMVDAVQRPALVGIVTKAVERIRALRAQGDERASSEVATDAFASEVGSAAQKSKDPSARRLRKAIIAALAEWDTDVRHGRYKRARLPAARMADEVLASVFGVAAETLRDQRTKRNRTK